MYRRKKEMSKVEVSGRVSPYPMTVAILGVMVGNGLIPANSTLIFEVILLGLK
jgi:hypothetical protein